MHLYRGEVSRANVWRQRLDQTTNWAIFVTATALGFAFGNDRGHHLSLMFANLMIYGLLVLEARRFRFFDVWRARVRKIETNFFGPILQRQLSSPEDDWALKVAGDLHTPHFHLTRLQALQLRLRRNYIVIFGIVLLAWVIKLDIHPEPATTLAQVYQRCGVATLPPWVTLVAVGSFYAWLLLILLLGRALQRSPMQDNWDIGEIVMEETRRL